MNKFCFLFLVLLLGFLFRSEFISAQQKEAISLEGIKQSQETLEPLSERQSQEYFQTGKTNYRIGVSVGYSFSGYREETYSDINRYLNSLTFLIDGNIEKQKFFHSFNIGFLMGNAESETINEPCLIEEFNPLTGQSYYSENLTEYQHMRGYLEYALDYRLWGNETFPGFLGGAFRSDLYMQFANYPSITGIVSLGAHASQKWIINRKNNLCFALGVPLFGYAVRPAYAGADHALIKYSSEDPLKVVTLGQVVSLHNYFAMFGNLKYFYEINSWFSLYSGLGFELSRIKSPRTRMDSRFTINLGLSTTF